MSALRRLLELLRPKTAILIHYDDYTVFKSPLSDFLDLVKNLRETESSKYTVRDTPIFTCIQMPMDQILDQLF